MLGEFCKTHQVPNESVTTQAGEEMARTKNAETMEDSRNYSPGEEMARTTEPLCPRTELYTTADLTSS